MATKKPTFNKQAFLSFISAHPRSLEVANKLLPEGKRTVAEWEKLMKEKGIEYTLVAK